MSNDAITMNPNGGRAPAVSPSSGASKPAADALPAAVHKGNATKPAPPEAEVVKKVAQQLESYLRSVSRSLEFRIDAESGRTVVSVRDKETGDLIRQIPNEEVLRLAEAAQDQTIVLLNETA